MSNEASETSISFMFFDVFKIDHETKSESCQKNSLHNKQTLYNNTIVIVLLLLAALTHIFTYMLLIRQYNMVRRVIKSSKKVLELEQAKAINLKEE